MRFDFKENKFVEIAAFADKKLIIGSDVSVTARQVFELYEELRNKILSLQIPQGHPVCIYGEKETLFPIAMLVLISLNLPYIPIDAMMPTGRIKKIAEESQSKLLINCSEKQCEVDFTICISRWLEILKTEEPQSFFVLENGDDPVCYILFTSGSTGVPKGVQITRSAFISFVNWYLTWPGIDQHAVFMNQAPFSFDVSLCDFLGAFAIGATVILNNYEVLKNGAVFMERLKVHKSNILVCTPSFIQMYLSVPEFNAESFPELKQMVFMGEELSVWHVKKLKKAFPLLRIVNAYGPTEATVVSTYIEITDSLLLAYPKSLPIGYARPGGEFCVLDKDPNSGVGELGISGPNLSIGYLNDPEKTKRAFIQRNNKTVYKTGDIGFIEDSLIFYLGRNDSQVKLNGYRIELDEISNLLLTHPAIKNVAVVPLNNGNVTKKIICFVLLSYEIQVNEDLKFFLSDQLPAYMIPSEFISLDEFPLNTNYKTDKKALIEIYLKG